MVSDPGLDDWRLGRCLSAARSLSRWKLQQAKIKHSNLVLETCVHQERPPARGLTGVGLLILTSTDLRLSEKEAMEVPMVIFSLHYFLKGNLT